LTTTLLSCKFVNDHIVITCLLSWRRPRCRTRHQHGRSHAHVKDVLRCLKLNKFYKRPSTATDPARQQALHCNRPCTATVATGTALNGNRHCTALHCNSNRHCTATGPARQQALHGNNSNRHCTHCTATATGTALHCNSNSNSNRHCTATGDSGVSETVTGDNVWLSIYCS
jgi:hypothetical protein